MLSFSCAILHAKRVPERVACVRDMRAQLTNRDVALRVFDEDKGAESWKTFQHKIAREQWGWALETGATHCVFMTDDLALSPRFLDVLSAMIVCRSDSALGLLSNHPAASKLADKGYRWYRTNSWLVGPCYVLPAKLLLRFVAWYDAMPSDVRAPFNDDSVINEWITRAGPGATYHPIPTIIEHLDVESTWCPGDGYSKQRLSWRHESLPVDTGHGFEWARKPRAWDIDAMTRPDFWITSAPLMRVVSPSEHEAFPVPMRNT